MKKRSQKVLMKLSNVISVNLQQLRKRVCKLRTRKHSETTSESNPITCEMCAVELKSKTDLKKPIKTHTSKFETCDFKEQDGWTIDIHYGKCHTENFVCGPCDFK